MAYRNRNFDRNNYGGSISRNVDPWDTSNDWSMVNNMRGGGGGGGNMGGGGGGHNNGGGGGGNYNPNPSSELANHLLNLLRNNGGNQAPPSLLDLPQADMRGYGYGGGRNSGGGGGDFDRFDDRRMGNNNHRQNQNSNNRNRRMGAGGGGGGGANNGPNARGGGGHHPPQQHMQNKGTNNNSHNQNNNSHGMNRNSGGIRKPNALDRSKKVLAKNSNNSKTNNSSANNNKQEAAATNKAKANNSAADQSATFDDLNEDGEGGVNPGDSVYADVPSDMFYCHLCKKHMWDCTSFENHVKGRTHQMMKEGVEESYRLKANMIRQEAKIDEQLKSIEVERLKRIGKSMKNANVHREYCQMCDLHFYGHLSTHRKSEGHLNLKKFLHPKCSECNDEFQNRIEFDAHLLSREHMLRLAKANRVDPRHKNQLMIHTEAEEVKDVREEKVKPVVATPAVKAENAEGGEATPATAEGAAATATGDSAAATTEGAAEGAATAENGDGTAAAATAEGGDEKAEKVEPENPDVILDYIEGTTEIGTDVEARIPKYKSSRAIAPSMIAKLECFQCKLCNRYFDTEKTAEIHSRTVNHHKQFSKFLTEKANETKIAQKRAAATIENEKRKRARMEKEEATAATNGGAGEAVKAETNGEAAAVAEESDAAQPEKKAKVELYDPAEATDEADNDVTMASVAPATPVVAAAVVAATPVAAVKPEPVAAAATPVVETPKPVAAPVTPAQATPSPANTPKSAGSGAGTPRGGRGGNRGNNRGRGRGRRF